MDFQSLKCFTNHVVKDLLRLKSGEALSINTDLSDFEIAAQIAKKALEITKYTVKIVQTENGRPTEVIDFDPPVLEGVPLCGYAMLSLVHKKKSIASDENVLDIIVDKNDLAAIQKLGHLAQPVVFNRRISVPWASVPADDELILNFLKKDINNCVLVTDYRKKYLHHADIHKLEIKGNETDFSICLPHDVLFVGGSTSLSNGRSFVCSLDFDKLSVNVDCNSAKGFLSAKASVLGKQQNLEISFKDSKAVLKNPSREFSLLSSFDDNLRKPGFLVLQDKSFHLYLGGALLDCFETEPQSEEELPEFFNSSLYSIDLELENSLNIVATSCNGDKTELVRKGFFLE